MMRPLLSRKNASFATPKLVMGAQKARRSVLFRYDTTYPQNQGPKLRELLR
jgi:hypothetical protein